MAKENKENKNVVETTSENIQEVINNASVITDDIAKAAAQKIADRRKEKLTEQLVDVTQKMEYTKQATLLSLRQQRRREKKISEYLKNLTALSEEISSGKKPVSDWDKEASALKSQLDKDVREIDADISESRNKLDDIFPNSWSYRYNSLIPGNR